MPLQPSNDILMPRHISLPSITTAVRRSLAAQPGTIVFDTDLSKIVFSKSATVATASWEIITSVQDA